MKISIIFLLLFSSVLNAKELYVSIKDGKTKGDGTKDKPFNTIQAAAKLAQAGDRVLIDEGIYREVVRPINGGKKDAPIVYQAMPGKKVIIRGTDVFKGPWSRRGTSNTYEAAIPDELFKDFKLKWTEKYFYTKNPFKTKIIISASGAKVYNEKKGMSQIARPWPQKYSGDDTEAKVTFDTDNRKVVYDGPAGTLPRTLGQVFVNDKPLIQARTMDEVEHNPGTFVVSADGKRLNLHPVNGADPNKQNIEITTRAQCFAPEKRCLKYLHIKGIIFERAANQGPFPQAGIVSFRSGSNWLFENNTVRYATTIGVDCGGETYAKDAVIKGGYKQPANNILRNNLICDNGLSGIAAYRSTNLLIENNIVARNNRMGYTPGIDAGWWEQAGIKLHIAPKVHIVNNLVVDNDAFGIWIDTGAGGSRITGNLLINNMFAGIFGEASKGAFQVDNNIIAFTRSGHGIYTHDVSDAVIAHNLCFRNAGLGVFLRNVRPMNTKYETSRNRVVNNWLLGNYQGAIGLPKENKKNKQNIADYNVVSGGSHFFDNGPVWYLIHSRERQFFAESPYSDKIGQGAVPFVWKDEDCFKVDLNMWRGLSNWGKHSIEPFTLKDKYMTLRPQQFNFELDLPDAVLEMTAPPVTETEIYKLSEPISKDYLGKALDEKVRPGPFQNLKSGRNIFYLKPLTEYVRPGN